MSNANVTAAYVDVTGAPVTRVRFRRRLLLSDDLPGEWTEWEDAAVVDGSRGLIEVPPLERGSWQIEYAVEYATDEHHVAVLRS